MIRSLRLPSAARAAVALVTAVVAFSGCSADIAPRECESALDCQVGQLCQAGSCFNACRDDDACGFGRTCDQGLCVQATRCAETDDCAFGYVCVDPYCVRQQDECATALDCPPGQECDRGACVPRTGLECLTRDDCDDNERCLDNRCVPADVVTDTGVDDTSDAEGQGGSDTDAGTPEPDADVATDVAAPQDTVSTPDTAPECRSLLDCPRDQFCNSDGRCVPNDVPDAGPGTDTGGTCQPREASCDVAADCCSTLCVPLGVGSAAGVCTEFCTDYRSCNPAGSLRDYFCALAGSPDGGTVNVCVVSDWERSCTASSDCLGQACLRSRSDSTCSWQCSRSSDCPPGSVCGPVETSGGTLNLCTPIGESCSGPPTDCMSGTCLTDDVTGDGYCSQFCDPGTGKTCPPGWLCSAPDPRFPSLTVCTLP
jgi:hypothetical protein